MRIATVIEDGKYESSKEGNIDGKDATMSEWLNIQRKMNKPDLQYVNGQITLNLGEMHYQRINQSRMDLRINDKGKYGKLMGNDTEKNCNAIRSRQ